jgi:hypothetical protein
MAARGTGSHVGARTCRGTTVAGCEVIDMERSESVRRMGRWGALLLGALIVTIGLTTGAFAQSSQTELIPGGSVGYAANGPARVDSVSADQIVLFAVPNPKIVKLKGKNVVVKDSNFSPTTFSMIQQGTVVTVYDNAKNVYIQLAPTARLTDVKPN